MLGVPDFLVLTVKPKPVRAWQYRAKSHRNAPQGVIQIYIYKITNDLNGKVYIGQTIRPVEKRFRRHILDALHCKIDTHFARAIQKYGEEHFSWEIIDTAESAEELNDKEVFWINYYDACHQGYNTSPGGYACGGNTYANLDNIEQVKEKLAHTKRGGRNPMSRKVVITHLPSRMKIIFTSMQEAADWLGLNSHMPISRRCRGEAPQPFRNKFWIEYYDEKSVTTNESASNDAVSSVA